MSGKRAIWSAVLCLGAITASLPAFAGAIDDLKPGEWYRVPNSSLRSVMPTPAPEGDPANIILAWSGATFDTKGNRLLLWGGGHNDYAGNEVYAFSIDTLSWSRLTTPSPSTGGDEGSGTYSDGAPRSGHSYNTLAYAESVDKMLIVGLAAVWFNGGSPGNSFQFDLATKSWSQFTRGPRLGDVKGGAAAYDSATGSVWYRTGGQGGLTKWDPAAAKWTDYGDDKKYLEIYATAAIDPQRRMMVSVGGYNGRQLFVWDLNNPGEPTTPNTTGPRDIEAGAGPGFTFDASSRKFIGWDSGSSVYVLDPASWAWSKIPAAATNTVTPGSPSPRGTFGRWRYVPSKNAFILVNAVDQDVYIYKLSNAAPVTDPTITFSATATTVQAQGSTTLTWSVTNANGCTGSGGWSGTKALSGTQSTGALAATGTFTLSCTNTAGGGASKSVTVTVSQTAPAPTVTLQANPTTVSSGSKTTLTWSSTNATGCVSSGGWAGNKAASGSTQSPALVQNSTFTLECTGAGGSATANAAVTIAAAGAPPPATPTLTLTASSMSVSANADVTLTWSTQNATACTASGAWSGTKATAASESVGPLAAGSPAFNLNCTGVGGSVSKSVTVTVAQAVLPTPPTSSATDSSGGGGGLGLYTSFGLLLALAVRLRRLLRPTAIVAGTLIAGTAMAADFTSVTLVHESSSAMASVPVTFGQVFRAGDVPSGSSISATTQSGQAIELQVDKKAAYADGSLRHAVITARLTSLGGNASEIVHLSSAASGSSGSAVTLANLLATSFDAEVRLNVGGTVYSASARSLLQSGTPEQWLSGPLASEWIVGGPVKTSGGVAHPHLTAYFHVRAYAGQPISRARVDVVIENGWTLVQGPATASYTIDTLIGGTSVGSRTVSHYAHTRWHQRYWWGTDPQIYVKQDKDYLQATKAVPRYADLNPSASYLNGLPSDTAPMDHGLLTQNFPNTGAQDAIGPLPRWTTSYVVSTDARAYRAMLAQDDAAGSYGIHFRDETVGKPVSIADHPTLSLQTGGALPSESGSNPNVPDAAHQPSIAFVSYLVTGDYYYLEELQFWTSWNQLNTNSNSRENAKGIFVLQVRGQAWSIRNLAQAAYATPDTHRYKSQLLASVGYNLAKNEAQYPDNANANKLGAIESYDGFIDFAPWMDDFYTWTMGYLVDLGFNANKMRAFKAQFPVGRMGLTDFCFLQAGSYHLKVGTPNSVWWPDFKTLYEQNFGTLSACPLSGTMDGYPDAPDGYPSNLRPALAVAVDAGVAGAAEAWDRLMQSRPQPDYNDLSNWAVMPRGSTTGAPSLTIAANPTAVQSGGSTTLTWSSSGATSCTASGAWSGTKAASGSEAIASITAAKTFTLSCTGSGQTTQRSVNVTIAGSTPPPTTPPPAAPSVSLSASPQSVNANEKSTLTWTSSNTTSCTASGGWSGTKAVSGSAQTAALTANATFNLSCTGAGGSLSVSTTVTVTPASTTPPPSTPTPPPATPTPPMGSQASSSGGGGAMDWLAATVLFALAVLRTAHSSRLRRRVQAPACDASCARSAA